MKYFIDTEFIEGTQTDNKWLILKRRGGGLMIGKPKPTIDLISIGIVAEDGREYYAISKDFNLKEAWNRYDIRKEWYSIDESTQSTRDIKVYWIRDNVLKPIFNELYRKLQIDTIKYMINSENPKYINPLSIDDSFTYNAIKALIERYGKTNKEIAEEVNKFITHQHHVNCNTNLYEGDNNSFKPLSPLEFYGYYADYDWVVFCWLFGKMIDLPKGFPMYCIDLKQTMDVVANFKYANLRDDIDPKKGIVGGEFSLEKKLRIMEKSNNYPKQTNEHHALADARWNKQLYEFLNKL